MNWLVAGKGFVGGDGFGNFDDDDDHDDDDDSDDYGEIVIALFTPKS